MRKTLIAVSVICGILAGCAQPGMGRSGGETTGSSGEAGSTAEGMRAPSPENPSAPDYRGGE